jgi:branched-chain amino acid aminotransferase
MIVWLDGALVDARDARIDPADHGFTLGDGLFETLAVRQGQIVRLDAHRARFKTGCETLGLPWLPVDLKAIIEAVCAANNFADAAARITLTRGIATRGLVPAPAQTKPTLLVTTAPLPGAPPPARCIIAAVTRRNEFSPLARVKSLNYLDGILARREAVARGANEAILLNTAGRVAETTVSNIFIVKNGLIYTPPVEDGALPGIMRATVLAAYDCIQKSLMPDDIVKADGVFLTNSLGIRTLASIDGKPAGNAARAFMESIRGKLVV